MDGFVRDPAVECLFLFAIDDLKKAQWCIESAYSSYQNGDLEEVRSLLGAYFMCTIEAIANIEDVEEYDNRLWVDDEESTD